MVSDDIRTINELIEKLRLGDIDGTIEIAIDNRGKLNKVLIRKENEDEIADEIQKIKLNKPDLSNVNFSGTSITGSLSGVNLSGSNFSYSKIVNSDLTYANLKGANLYNAVVSQSDLSNSSGLNGQSAYITGSTNLYNVSPSTDVVLSNPYSGLGSASRDDYGAQPADMSMIKTPSKRKTY